MAIELLGPVVGPHWCKGTNDGSDKCVPLSGVEATLQIHTLPPEGYCDVSLAHVQTTRSTEKDITECQSRSIHGNLRSY